MLFLQWKELMKYSDEMVITEPLFQVCQWDGASFHINWSSPETEGRKACHHPCVFY